MSVRAHKELARRTLMRRRLLYFTQQTLPGYQAGWVHDDVCRRLERFSQQVKEKKSPRLMLLMPPRHGKSELASIRFPAWHLGHNPQHEIINVGYNLDLPMKFSRRVREIFRDPAFEAIFPDARLDPDSQSIESWLTTRGGGLMATGVGGGLTGKGAHVLTIDDPIKNIEEADSIVVRDAIQEWYESTAYTRLAPGGGVLLIETWWNDDDLAGRLMQKMRMDPFSDQFEIVKYPALAEQHEYRHRRTMHLVRSTEPKLLDETIVGSYVARKLIGESPRELEDDEKDPEKYELLRQPGDALHEARYPVPDLQRIKANMAPRLWSALYQQNPVPDEGAYFQREYFRYEHATPQPFGRHVYTAWDFAIGEKQHNDWNVGATIIQDEYDVLHVAGINRFRGDSYRIVEEILNTAEPYIRHPNVGYTIGFEDGQIWRAIEPLLKKRMAERGLYPSYEVLKPLTDKLARGRNLQGRMQQGRVYFPETAPWKDTTVQEMLRFPAGAHDDVVDALAWCVNLCIGKPPPRRPEGPKLKSWRDKIKIAGTTGNTHMSA